MLLTVRGRFPSFIASIGLALAQASRPYRCRPHPA